MIRLGDIKLTLEREIKRNDNAWGVGGGTILPFFAREDRAGLPAVHIIKYN